MVQSASRTSQQLFKILIAAAWIDGEFQPAEKAYLQKIAEERNLLKDAEIQNLLVTEARISSEQCYQWLNEYLGDRPTLEAYQTLLAEIAGLVYVDGDIDDAEAQLLTQLQRLDPAKVNSVSMFKPVLKLVRQFYRNFIG